MCKLDIIRLRFIINKTYYRRIQGRVLKSIIRSMGKMCLASFHIVMANAVIICLVIGSTLLGVSNPEKNPCLSSSMCITGFVFMMIVPLLLVNWLIFGVDIYDHVHDPHSKVCGGCKAITHSLFSTLLMIALMVGATLIGIARPQTFANPLLIGGFVCMLVFVVGGINYIIVSCCMH